MERKTMEKHKGETINATWNFGTSFFISDTIPGNYSNISNLGKTDTIFKRALGGDMLAAC